VAYQGQVRHWAGVVATTEGDSIPARQRSPALYPALPLNDLERTTSSAWRVLGWSAGVRQRRKWALALRLDAARAAGYMSPGAGQMGHPRPRRIGQPVTPRSTACRTGRDVEHFLNLTWQGSVQATCSARMDTEQSVRLDRNRWAMFTMAR
jgi:hypothetical protein